MIILKNMYWSYAFSYGPNNSIDFSKYPLVQLIGKNGHGKSSIALILEEVIFNKNSKGVKKANILNRHSNSNKYEITLHFSVNDDDYVINTVRGTTQSVSLLKNSENISAHTSTATYKLIEEIIGMDHKTFTQIVYQSNAFSLEFLTATDSNRKKFLIDLLNLERYTKACDSFKSVLKDTVNQLEVVAMKQNTVKNWLQKFSKESVEELELVLTPDPIDAQAAERELPEVQEQIATIDSTNKKIIQNNKYKEILNGIDITPVEDAPGDLIVLRIAENEYLNRLNALEDVIRGIGPIITKCPSCGQKVDSAHKQKMLEEAKLEIPNAKDQYERVSKDVKKLTEAKKKYATYVNNKQEWERYYSFIDNNLPSKVIDIQDLNKRKTSLITIISQYDRALKETNESNAKITAHNAKVKVLKEQLATMQKDFESYTLDSDALNKHITNLQILVKAFGTSGLVAYKIECLVKDLEDLVNEYLVDMSDGRFQLGFSISASDKLDVIITDNGQDIDIFALSNGELARVNVSTLLAIRKLMQSLSETRINLLILDETVESLDADGKERLIEILLKEEYLNTMLVSHGFSHPLLEKVHIVKENNISRIE